MRRGRRARDDAVARALESLAMWARTWNSTRRVPFAGTRLTHSQLDALFLLAHSSEPLTCGRLADALGRTPGAVTQLVTGLRLAGLVDQRSDPADARVRQLTVSDACARQVEDFERGVVAQLAPRFAALSDDEVDALADLLDRTTHRP